MQFIYVYDIIEQYLKSQKVKFVKTKFYEDEFMVMRMCGCATVKMLRCLDI